MNRMTLFRKLHEQRPLVLPNAWDAASARVIELAGAQAIATTSAAVSWTRGRGDGETLRREAMLRVIRWFDETVRRAKVYRAAGADGLFVPGVVDAETIGALVRAIDGPLNVMAMPSAPTVPQLGKLGVARVSVGPSIAQAALAATRRAAL